jgi:hypothetical protein
MSTKTVQCHIGRLWFAVRFTTDSLALGIGLDMTRPWVTMRFGPLCFDIAWGNESPRWNYD